MKFENTHVDEVFIQYAIHGARLSYGNVRNSDSVIDNGLVIGSEDERFLKARLSASVQGENKFLRTIPATVKQSDAQTCWQGPLYAR